MEEVYNSVHNINFQYKMEAKLNNYYSNFVHCTNSDFLIG